MRVRRATAAVASVVTAAALAAAAAGMPASASPPAEPRAARTHAPDDMPNPLGDKMRATRKAALEKVLRGEAKVQRRGKSDVVQLGKKKFAQLSMEKTDKIFTILVDFGDKTDPRTGGTAGPVHNQIPQPDRAAADDTDVLDRRLQPRALPRHDVRPDGESIRGLLPQAVATAGSSPRATSPTGCTVPYNEARYGSNEHRPTPTATGTSSRTPPPPGTTPRRPPARRRRRDQDLPRAVRQRGTATTSTATATSTSPTATSTTSRPSTPVRARRPAAAPRARTPSGRTAGTPTPTDAARPARRGNKRGGVPDRQLRHLDR